MDVTPLVREGQQIIQSYAADGFKVSGVDYKGSIIVTPSTVFSSDMKDMESLTADSFSMLADQNIDVLLLGTGPSFQFVPDDLKNAVKQYGFSLDVMDNGAACRTYNVLMAEGRHVAAALLTSK